ncbi:MAG TPA: hypothetical protein VMB21_20370 [Candidatus Limnocylindria bacterium]|jgi:hypothetical protein|nr:hypothetical protein [Candidatus Limnocylindria bacterium]
MKALKMLALALLIVSCSADPRGLQSVSFNGQGDLQERFLPGEIVSSLYYVEGSVRRVEIHGSILQSIELRIRQKLPTAKGTWSPFELGETVRIRFDSPVARFGAALPERGAIVRLVTAQFSQTTNSAAVWGSAPEWVTVQSGMNFLDASGTRTDWVR